jgi:hypothetical protein
MTKNMKIKKIKKETLECGIVLAIIAIAIYLLYGGKYKEYRNSICNINILEYNTTGLSYDELNEYLQSQMSYNIEDLSVKDALSYDFSKPINSMKKVTFKDYLSMNYDNIDFTPTFTLDDDVLSNLIDKYNSDKKESKDAYIVFDKNSQRYIIEEEIYGEKIDAFKFKNWLKNHLSLNSYIDGKTTLDEFYVKPNVKTKDLEGLVDEANHYASWYVSYENGSVYTFDVATAVKIEDGEIIIDDSFLSDIASKVYKEFTASGLPKEFLTSNEETITVKGGTWGKEVWKAKELEELMYAFYAHENLDMRKPIYVIDYDEIGDTYVEISIENQHCWVYKNGECVMDTDIVTGTKGKHDTPTGIYYITERIDGKYLTGADYKTWVDKWMRLTWNGIGLHDASWRNAFGDKIYKSNGSHGCINLPVKFAYNLYEMSYTGMPVIIY